MLMNLKVEGVMKKLIADMHMHTIVSGHAYVTIREMVDEAKKGA